MRVAAVVMMMLALAGCFETEPAEPAPTTSTPAVTTQETTAPKPSPEPAAEPTGEKRPPVTWTIDIESFDFVDGSITIQVGDTVRWTQQDTATHTVTADDGAFDSGHMGQGDEFAHTFGQVGEFAYQCQLHASMRDSILVRERHDGTP